VLGKELRKARIAAGLTQEDLAFKAKIARNYISLLELDRKSPTLKTFFQLCRALNVRPSSLIKRIENVAIRSGS
jgi:transcriptional regulator with XRE-family HTH domain